MKQIAGVVYAIPQDAMLGHARVVNVVKKKLL